MFACNIYITARFRHLRNYLKEMDMFHYTIAIFRSLRLRCSKFITMQLHQYLRRFSKNEIKTTNYATLHTFQFHLLKVYIMDLKAYHFQVLRFGILCQQELKETKTLNAFKSGIKNWPPILCPWSLCKRYLSNIGFI